MTTTLAISFDNRVLGRLEQNAKRLGVDVKIYIVNEMSKLVKEKSKDNNEKIHLSSLKPSDTIVRLRGALGKEEDYKVLHDERIDYILSK